MKKIVHALFGLLIYCSASAQTPIVFEPEAGLNDGTDEGGQYGGKDTWVYDGDPATNYGGNSVCYSMPLTTCNSTNVRGFLKFDVVDLPASVDSVVLAVDFLDQTNYCYSNCQASFSFNYVDAAWDEMGMTWNNQPQPSEAFAGPFSVSFPEVGGERHYDVTDAYLAWRSGSRVNNGFTMVPLDGSCNNAAIFFGFYSSDDTTVAHEPVRLLIYENTSGIQEDAAWKEFRIAPNPITERTTLYLPNGLGSCTVSLFDASGRQVRSFPFNGGITSAVLSMEGLEAGAYIVQIASNDHGMVQRRLLKQ